MAQHCAPIWESYLSEISVRHDAKQKAINVKIEYTKHGRAPHSKYQAYLLAYLEKNEGRALSPPPADLINKQVVCVLHTQVIELNKGGAFDFAVQLNVNDLAKKIIELGHLTEKDRLDDWGVYKDRFHMAVFVPFLADQTYSVLKGLPEDKHECNWDHSRALFYQPLPYYFTIHYGTDHTDLPKDEIRIWIHGADRPKHPARQ